MAGPASRPARRDHQEDGTSIKVVLGEDPGDPVFTIADLLPHLAQKEVTKTVADAFDAESST